MHNSIGRYISSIYRHQSIYINHAIKDLNLTIGQYHFLIHIEAQPGITQKALSEHIHIDRANTTRGLKKLLDNKFIIVESDDSDHRIKRSYITDLGRSTVKSLKIILKEVTDVLCEGMSEEEIYMLFELLIRVETNAQSQVQKIREATNEA